MILPAIAYYRFKRHILKSPSTGAQQFDIQDHPTGLPESASIRVIRLPEVLDASFLESGRASLETEILTAMAPILDFKKVGFIDSAGLGFIVSLWRRAMEADKKLTLIEIRPTTRRFFELSRTIDVFRGRVFDNLDEAVAAISSENSQPPFYYIKVPRQRNAMLKLCGSLDAAQMPHLDIEAILEAIGDRDGLMDLRQLDFVDSSGIVLFLKIQKHVQKIARRCVLFGLPDNVRQMFRITKLDRLFSITADLAAAERYLEQAESEKKS
jgi:anti-sigma B factor antagonist